MNSEKIKVEISLFGAFRKYNSGVVQFEFNEGKTCEQVKWALGDYLQSRYPDFDKELVQTSVLADDKSVLASSTLIERNCSLAVLPPVCGG
jgi:molybdopterin converting factor small subunit